MPRTPLLARRSGHFSLVRNPFLLFLSFCAPARVIIAAVTLLVTADSFALSCVPARHDAEAVQERVGRADFVFLGKIQSVSSPVRFDHWSQSVQAKVVVERVFKDEIKGELKGDARGVVEVYVSATLKVNERVILYAATESADAAQARVRALTDGLSPEAKSHERSPTPLLRADGPCAEGHRSVSANSPEGPLHLQHLSALPASGSGGTLKLRVIAHASADWLPGYELVLKNTPVVVGAGSAKFKAETGVDGWVLFSNLPAGSYALSMPRVEGFTQRCWGATNCDALTVTDRGLRSYTVDYDPDASV
jgi:hypothetical protein